MEKRQEQEIYIAYIELYRDDTVLEPPKTVRAGVFSPPRAPIRKAPSGSKCQKTALGIHRQIVPGNQTSAAKFRLQKAMNPELLGKLS